MQLTKLFSAVLGAGILALGLNSGQAQTTAIWTNTAGGNWNTPGNWTNGFPDSASSTSALITNGGTYTVTYNAPMTQFSIPALTLGGFATPTLAITATGFNVVGASTLNASCSLMVNAGGVMTNGSLSIAVQTASVTVNGGTMTNATTSVSNNGSNDGGPMMITNNAVANLGNVTIKRSGATAFVNGLTIKDSTVSASTVTIGTGNSYCDMSVGGGSGTTVNIAQNLLIGYGNAVGRASLYTQTNGTANVAGVVALSGTAGEWGYFNLTAAGIMNAGGVILFSNAVTNCVANFTNGGTMYLGASGFQLINPNTNNISLNNGGLFGASAPWTGNMNAKLSGGTFTFQTADALGNPNNITLSGNLNGSGGLTKTGSGGILTLSGANTYVGNTAINAGTLALGASGTLASPRIFTASGTTYDVSQVAGYTVNASQMLAGFGTVNGAVAAGANSTVFPGSNAITGTLTFNSSLTETGAVLNEFNLGTTPSGPGNDFINATGGLALTGTNTLLINGVLQSGGVYPLINYNGILTGDVTNLIVSGDTGTLSNSATAGIIFFLPQSSIRNPTNVVWIGNPTVNNWDTEASTNWLNTGTGALDFFVPNDTAFFSNLGATNSVVNFPGTVTPATVIVNTTSNYTFTGIGAIGGIGSLVVSNGLLNVLTTNTYNGPTILDGGTLLTALIGTSGSPSGIGAATSDPGNFILNGGTFAYDGGSVSTDHGITLGAANSTIDVTNGTTLTLSGTINGNGGVTLVDSGTLVLSGANNYTGTTTISNGTLNLNNVIGAGSGTIAMAGGNLGLTLGGGQQTYANNVTVLGNGTLNSAGDNNNIMTGGWAGNTNVTVSVLIASNSTFSVSGNMTNYYGTIELGNDQDGTFRFNSGGGNTTFGAPNATIDLGTSNSILQARNAATIAVGTLEGGFNTFVKGQGSGSGTLIWQLGGNTNNPSATYYGTIETGLAANDIAGISIVGTGTVSLAGQNTYTGTTTVNSGVLALTNNPFNGADGSIADSATINVVSGATLDASGRSDHTFQLGNGVNQTLEGRGTINGILNAQGQGLVAPGGGPGGSTGVLTVNNTVNLGGTVWMKVDRTNTLTSDEIVAPAAINYGGTLIVTNIGPTLQPNDTFKLFNGSSLNGGFTIVLPTYTGWDTSQLNVNGTIKFLQAYTPVISSYDFSQLASSGTISLTITNGAPYGNFNILTSTNLAAPLSTWTVNTSSGFGPSGTLSNFQINVDQTQTQQYIIFQGF